MEENRLTWKQRGQLWLRLGIRLVLAALILTAAGTVLPPVLSLLAPFLLGYLMAAALNPVVRWLQRRLGWSRGLLSMLVVLVVFGLLGGGIVLLVYGAGREILSLAQNWEGLFSQSALLLEQMDGLFARFWALIPQEILQGTYDLWENFTQWFQKSMSVLLAAAAEYVTDKAMGAPGFFLGLVMFLMATYFLSADYPYLRTRMIQMMDDRVLCHLSQVRKVAVAAFGGYLKAQILLSAGVFLILLLGFLVSRQDYAFLLALGLAILDFIPLLGSGTVMVPWAVVAFLTRDYPTAISVMVIWGIIALFRRVAEPKIVGDQTGLSPVLSLISIYAGMKLGGVPGMILGPILTLVVLNLSGLGMFHNLRLDLADAVEDIASLLRRPVRED